VSRKVLSSTRAGDQVAVILKLNGTTLSGLTSHRQLPTPCNRLADTFQSSAWPRHLVSTQSRPRTRNDTLSPPLPSSLSLTSSSKPKPRLPPRPPLHPPLRPPLLVQPQPLPPPPPRLRPRTKPVPKRSRRRETPSWGRSSTTVRSSSTPRQSGRPGRARKGSRGCDEGDRAGSKVRKGLLEAWVGGVTSNLTPSTSRTPAAPPALLLWEYLRLRL
jgi:hypothetical protein